MPRSRHRAGLLAGASVTVRGGPLAVPTLTRNITLNRWTDSCLDDAPYRETITHHAR